MKRFAIALLMICVFTSSCSKLFDLVSDSGDALKQDLFEVSDSLENNIENLSENLLAFLESDRMNVLVDSVVQQASKSFVAGLNIDSVLAVVDGNIDATLAGVLDSLLSVQVANEIGNRLKTVLETSGLDPESLKNLLLNEETTAFVVNLKNELLGNTTPALVDSIMVAAMLVFEDTYNRTVGTDIKKLSKNIEDINNNVGDNSNDWERLLRNGLISGLSVLSLGLLSFLGFRIYKERQYKSLVRVMASKIDKMKDQAAYDELTKEIQNATESNDLDELLEKSIKDIKEASAKEWQNKDHQVLRLLSKYANKSRNGVLDGSTMQQVKMEAEKVGLLEHLESTLERFGEST